MKSTNVRIAAVLVVVIILCASAAYLWPSHDDDSPVGSPWVNSMLDGNLSDERAEAVDDFYQWVNYEGISDLELKGSGITGEIYEMDTAEDFWGYVAGDGDGWGWEVLHTAWEMATDAETRESLGIEPLRPYIEDVLSISSVEEYAEYISSPDALFIESAYNSIIRTPEDMNGLYLEPVVIYSYVDPTAAVPILEDALLMFGISESKASEIVSLGLSAEGELASAMDGDSEMWTTLDEISATYPDCRIADTFAGAGFPGDTEILTYGGWIGVYESMFSDDCLEGLKSLTIIRYLGYTSYLLGSELSDLTYFALGDSTDFAGEEQAELICNGFFRYIVPGLYSEVMVTAEERAVGTMLTEEILEAYRGMIQDCAWMSDSTKASALEKLSMMRFSVAESDFGYDLYGYDLSGAGNLLELAMIGERMTVAAMAESAGEAFDPETIWTDWIMETNAAYYPGYNIFVICGGMLKLTDGVEGEVALARLGDTIAHEISHAFDTDGRFYDETGNLNDWWAEGDSADGSDTDQDGGTSQGNQTE